MEYIEKLKLMTSQLEKCSRVSKHSNDEENQADTLANAFIDIEESARKITTFVSELYNKELVEESIDDLILDIGEELRQVLYHLNDTKVYDYLKSD
jgi:K+/H+ antiporter YhaU regulatory subunit KhtT